MNVQSVYAQIVAPTFSSCEHPDRNLPTFLPNKPFALDVRFWRHGRTRTPQGLELLAAMSWARAQPICISFRSLLRLTQHCAPVMCASRSARMTAAICSSVNRDFRIAPSNPGASLLRLRWSEISGAGHGPRASDSGSDKTGLSRANRVPPLAIRDLVRTGT
jgi:hypothetical protein